MKTQSLGGWSVRALGILGILILESPILWATSSNHIDDFLVRFAADPARASQERPIKRGDRYPQKFSDQVINEKTFVEAKDEFRAQVLCAGSEPGEPCLPEGTFFPMELFNEHWLLWSFLGGDYEPHIFNLTAYDQGSVRTTPWSGHYWPIYQGGIGARYADARFPRSQTFKVNYEYFKKNYLKSSPPDEDQRVLLSPAEKYDLIMADPAWNLTQSVWRDGKAYMDATGKVETWMGICHGWAVAAFMVPEPRKAIDVTLGNGTGVVRVFPHDLKGLISQLWAQGRFNHHMLGGRCNIKNPKTDKNGRIISPECFDVNPATWHLVLTHLVGKQGQSFVLDATYDYEVWNQPISSYRLTYFNPATKQNGSLQDSVVPYTQMEKDVYQQYRSANVKYLVGVISDIRYVVEEYPDQNESIHNSYPRIVGVSYYYDLELDENYKIIGGEWYQQAHPDMLWKPMQGAFAIAQGEHLLPEWEGFLPLPQNFLEVGIRASTHKTPLSRILNRLVEWSQL